MAAFFNSLQPSNSGFESPAKLFAKLKSKVQTEVLCAKEGVFTNNGPPTAVRDKHGADFNSPRKRSERFWVTDELKDNHRFGPYRREVQALTLSPISSPQKTPGRSFSDSVGKHVERMPRLVEPVHNCISRNGHTPTKRVLPGLLSHINREQILTEPPHIRDSGGFMVPSRTPVKTQSVQNDRVRSVYQKECASPVNIYSPMRNRLRKRKWSQEITNAVNQPRGRTSPVLSDDDSHITGLEDLGDIGGLPAGQSGRNQFTHEHTSTPPRSNAVQLGCSVIMEKMPMMTPAKMFSYMKERERKRELQGVHEVSSSTRELLRGVNSIQSRDTTLYTDQMMDNTEDLAFRGVRERVVSVNCSRVDTADSQSDLTEEVPVPAVESQPVLLEDPLVLNSPRISIPNKHQAVFKRNKLPNCENFPNESVIHLTQWFLRRTQKGLFVDGINREKNIPWNSNVIVDRVSQSVLKTVSGRVYILVGKMMLDVASGFPKWFLKKFVSGFPPNWKALYEKFLLESRDRETGENSEERNDTARKKSETPPADRCRKQQRRESFKTPDSCPLVSSSSSKVSRSGRVIKPPLEYWKGGRVILDAHMNVTIHEGYDTSVCIPEVLTTVSARKSQTPTHVFLPHREGRKQHGSASEEEVSVPLRKVKASLRKHKQSKIDFEERLSNIPEPTADTVSSPEGRSSRTARSSRRGPAAQKMLPVDTVDPKQRDLEKPSTRRSKKQTHGTSRPPVRRRMQAVSTSPQSLSFDEEAVQQQASDEEISIKRKKKGNRQNRKRGGKPKTSHVSPSSQSSAISEDSEKKLRRVTTTTKNSDAAQTWRKCNKMSPASKPSLKSTQSWKKHKANKSNIVPQEQDEDEWTEEELMKLREAVSYYPNHMTGYWAKVARVVETRSAAECHQQHTSQGASQTPNNKAKKSKPEKVEAPKDSDHPVISARAGTFKRKQQVRQFLDAMPKDDVDDVFNSAYMQNKQFEIPSMCPSDDHDFKMSDMEPVTPMSKNFPDVKTPQCLHITPGMMGSPNRNNDDKFVYQVQKRMKKNQYNICKQAPSSRRFKRTPSVKRSIRRCGNTENSTFVVWEMFPGNEGVLSDSGEEEDFYFSDD